MEYEQDLISLIKETPELTSLLEIISTFKLSNWALCAGTIRNLIWSQLSYRPYSAIKNNIDILYSNSSESYEHLLTTRALITQKYPNYLWNLQNTALTSTNGREPHGKDLLTAISTIPENCSAVGVYLENNKLQIIAPYGLKDLFKFEVHPSPLFMADPKKLQFYRRRMLRKNWPALWPEVLIFDD
ncbi:nucleotidyltransferase family protein [Liquorilactobacillus capillatus]|uniref:Nucleotidyltransferase family protein n=1 Tax=Liquorilactobacillus capillatus DSM 19910 TaxID=1423731 RepID=A0A0R1MDG1_9LACO|nr:nucleotidyltransferase family protein [Liquorilactobacillus capillatus]KRL03154.1 hypothetical protein FC81_GL000156 [Liquorilactobacillus capillatus DSM 19910]